MKNRYYIVWLLSAFVGSAIGGLLSYRAGSKTLAADYGEQICYFVVDGNTIDLGYEGERWRRVMFYDDNDLMIGEFTRNSPEVRALLASTPCELCDTLQVHDTNACPKMLALQELEI